MGLFHLGKKKEIDAESALNVNDLTQKVNIKDQAYTNDENRRFIMMIEETFPAQGDDGIVTVGMVRGTIKNGDAVYLLEPGGRIRLVNVIGLAVQHNSAMNPVEEVMDRVAGVKIYDINGQKSAQRFGVLTSIKPQTDRKEIAGIENPYILGLSFGYQKFNKVAEYFNILISELLETTMLVPLYTSEKGPAVLKYVNKEGKSELTVFTDKYEFMQGKWNGAADQEKAMRAATMKFVDCVEMLCTHEDGKTAGVVVNTFGKYPLTVPMDIIRGIYRSEEYKRICRKK